MVCDRGSNYDSLKVAYICGSNYDSLKVAYFCAERILRKNFDEKKEKPKHKFEGTTFHLKTPMKDSTLFKKVDLVRNLALLEQKETK